MSKVYLATPYTHHLSSVRRQRYAAVTNAAGLLMQRGLIVYSPITHNHPIAELHDLPHDWDYWKRIDEAFLRWADRLFVLTLDGWMQSRGVAAEIEIARHLSKPVHLWAYGEEPPECPTQPEP